MSRPNDVSNSLQNRQRGIWRKEHPRQESPHQVCPLEAVEVRDQILRLGLGVAAALEGAETRPEG